MQAAVSSFQAFSVEGFCRPILVVHLSWIKTPDPCLKFCTNIIIYKNSFSTECIHTHIDVYMCRQNPHVNNTKYGFLKFHININTCRYKLWAIFQLLFGQNFTSCYLLPLLGIDCQTFPWGTCSSTSDGCCCLKCRGEVHIPGKMFKAGFRPCGDHWCYL